MLVAARQALLGFHQRWEAFQREREGWLLVGLIALGFALGFAWSCAGPLPFGDEGAGALMRADAFKACARDHFCMVQNRPLGAPDPWPWTRRDDPRDAQRWVLLASQEGDFSKLQAWRWAQSHARPGAVIIPQNPSSATQTLRRRVGWSRPADYGLAPQNQLLLPNGSRADGFNQDAFLLLLPCPLFILLALIGWPILSSLLEFWAGSLLDALRRGARLEPAPSFAWRLGAFWALLGGLCLAAPAFSPPRQGPHLRLDAAMACASLPYCPLGSTAADSLLAQLGPGPASASSWVELDADQAKIGPLLAQRFAGPRAFSSSGAPGAIDVWRPSAPSRFFGLYPPEAKSAPLFSSQAIARRWRQWAGIFFAAAALCLASSLLRAGAFRLGRKRSRGSGGRLALDFDQAFGLIDPQRARAQAELLDLGESCAKTAPAKKPASRL